MRVTPEAHRLRGFCPGCSPERRTQAGQRSRWMPGRVIPKKDAETGETFKGSCMQAMSLESPNGATPPE